MVSDGMEGVYGYAVRLLIGSADAVALIARAFLFHRR